MLPRSLLILIFMYVSIHSFGQTNVIVLGTAQDGGYPHMGCQRSCCAQAYEQDSLKQFVVSLALADFENKKWWLFEATPDIKEQLHLFAEYTQHQFGFLPEGIFLTHAHIGHYTGLMQLGKEVMNAGSIPVYTLPRFKKFMETNGPWSQLVNLKNISLTELKEDKLYIFPGNVSVTAFRVPHRDEFSETAGFKIITREKSYLFIPDIDKWSKWNKDIVREVKAVDEAYLDATFYSSDELPNRKMTEVPHPLVSETIDLFKSESREIRGKIHFIHFNHTNPLLFDVNNQKMVKDLGFQLARQVGIH
jgi:pyrroloquinoline quinone biosynthesis protein B